MAAKSDTKKQRSPEIEIVWKGNVPEATYLDRNGYSIVAKVENGQFILTRDGWDDDPEKKDIVTVSVLYRETQGQSEGQAVRCSPQGTSGSGSR
jgi:hypothetical protein